tara:strand:- start:94465 stop:94806 length:342 start_codon:yes stop_codon:yes gene_type:complete
MQLPTQKQPVALTDLAPCDSFGEPMGALPKQTYKAFHATEGYEMGTWECEPGKLRLEIQLTEFCHLIKGHWILTSDEGEITELRPGDSFVFPKGWKGVSDVVDTVRKVYTFIF